MASYEQTSRETWAVLVGINWYSDEDESQNLEGCVNDVEITKDILQCILTVPEDHITVLTAEKAPEALDPPQPTSTNVINAINKVAQQAKPGDLFYFHYSGHGDRIPTAYSDLKHGVHKDEVLCTLEKDIRDVEFGELLRKVAMKLAVCAVVDCCFSGGVDRLKGDGKHEPRVRCRTSSSLSPQSNISRDRHSRNAVPRESWFYRPRGYNLVAAAQPHEKAREYGPDESGKVYGRMTYHLVKTLKQLKTSIEPVTYGNLQDILEARLKAVSKNTNKRQQPIHLGPRDRIIFGGAGSAANHHYIVASVIFVDMNRVRLNKGSASGIHQGDRFDVYDTSIPALAAFVTNPRPVATLEITEVRGLDSVAILCNRDLMTSDIGIKIGWFARLSKRATTAKILIKAPYTQPSIIAKLKAEWHQHVDHQFPLCLTFDRPVEDPDIIIEVDKQSVFWFRDRNGHKMDHIPFPGSDSSWSSLQIMNLLKHLCLYQSVANLTHPSGSRLPKYKFALEKTNPNEEDPKCLSSWKIRFKNKHSRVLYLTILNLTPVYGIHQIFPNSVESASSRAVEPGAEIPDLVVDIVAPNFGGRSQRTGDPDDTSSNMTDLIKIIVATEQTHFFHFLLPGLEDPENADSSEGTCLEEIDDDFDDIPGGDSDLSDEDFHEDENSDAEGDNTEERVGRTAKSRATTATATWFVDEWRIVTPIPSE